jgi:hypothetical protein
MEYSTVPLWTFTLCGVLAILAGGLLAAFSAKKPTRQASWASAYLVLIVGLAQAIIGVILYAVNAHVAAYMIVFAFVTFNLGNAGVVIGTDGRYRNKSYRKLVDIGGALMVVSMLTLLVTVWGATFSWQLMTLYVVIAIILVTMPIGIVLSHRRKIE